MSQQATQANPCERVNNQWQFPLPFRAAAIKLDGGGHVLAAHVMGDVVELEWSRAVAAVGARKKKGSQFLKRNSELHTRILLHASAETS